MPIRFRSLLPFIGILHVQPTNATAPFIQAQDSAISLHRKGTIRILAAAGTQVRVRQKTHEFRFGTAISEAVISKGGGDADYQKFTEIAGKYFNSATDEYAMKWDFVEQTQGKPDWTKSDMDVEWCRKLGLEIRGHTLYWPHQKWMQEWIKTGDNASVLAAIDRHGRETTARYAGKILEWDVNNEMVHYPYYEDRFGAGLVHRMFKAAREGEPQAKLYTNEHEILSGEWSGKYHRHIDSLRKAGLKIDGIGMQGHLWDASSALISNNTTRAAATVDGAHDVLEKFSGFGLPIRITEYDFGSSDEAKKARKLVEFYRLFFSKPYIAGITMWGFWQGRHWRPDAYLWDKGWNAMPAAEAYIGLVWKEWFTDTAITVGPSSAAEVRAFYGRHEITLAGIPYELELKKSIGSAQIDANGKVTSSVAGKSEATDAIARTAIPSAAMRLFPGGLGFRRGNRWVDMQGAEIPLSGPLNSPGH